MTSARAASFAGPNDLVFDKTGGFWFTDHGATLPEYRKHGALYYARPDGSKVVRHRDHLISPNGVGLSPDESVVYMADTHLGRLYAFDVAAPGELAPPAGFAPGRVIKNLEGFQLLDSLAVEAGGKVCVATIVNGGITAFDPDGSIEHYAFPDILTTNICFGGADMRDAWVTCSSTGKLYKARWPRPGLKLKLQRVRRPTPEPFPLDGGRVWDGGGGSEIQGLALMASAPNRATRPRFGGHTPNPPFPHREGRVLR